jgi:ubiquinone/menaquinone biosynthesis C-methylase UbiE
MPNIIPYMPDTIPLPPVRMRFDGPQDDPTFRANGAEFLAIYRDLCHLSKDAKMLDVGSGIGRKTIPLVDYLSPEATYQGFDVNRIGVDWCTANITARYPNFSFQHINVANAAYNPEGTIAPSAFKFPYANDSFDFVTACSLFTHMKPVDGRYYLSEIQRVLKPGGCFLATYFLIGAGLTMTFHNGRSEIDFRYTGEDYRTTHAEVAEHAVAYSEAWVRRKYAQLRLPIEQSHYGNWCRDKECVSYQDILIASKR